MNASARLHIALALLLGTTAVGPQWLRAQQAPPADAAPRVVTEAAVGATEVIALKRRGAAELARIIQAHLQQSYTSQELARGSVVADERTNSLVLRTASRQAVWFQDAVALIARLDAPLPQTRMEVLLVEEAEDSETETESKAARLMDWEGAEVRSRTAYTARAGSRHSSVVEIGVGNPLNLVVFLASVDAGSGGAEVGEILLGVPMMGADGNPTTGTLPLLSDATGYHLEKGELTLIGPVRVPGEAQPLHLMLRQTPTLASEKSGRP